MIEIIKGSEYRSLAEALTKSIVVENTSIFKPTHIIVPNLLMEEWLKEAIARLNGIAANIKFLRPESFFNELLYRLQPEHLYEKPFRLNDLDWLVYEILGSDDFKKAFPQIRDYYSGDDVKRFALAEKTVRLLDKYLQFRPDMLRKWLSDAHTMTSDWQTYVFLQLKAIGGDKVFASLAAAEQIEKLLGHAETAKKLSAQMGAVHFFGNISLSPLSFQVLKAAEDALNIKIYRARIDFEENAPVQFWAKTQEAFWKAIDLYLPNSEIHSIDSQNAGDKGESLEFQRLLAGKQALGLHEDSTRQIGIEIHSCHTRIREVESLYNYLVRKAEDQELPGSRDIVVYAPNLQLYVASIKTVFDTAPYYFPYRMVSRRFSKEESFWTALIDLLAIDENNFTAPLVYQLIERKAIRNHFGFEDLELLKKMIHDAGIRFHLDGNIKDETRYLSWRHGLKRLYYGYLLGRDGYKYDDGNETLYTVDLVEGGAASDLFRLNFFVEQLAEIIEAKRSEKTLQEWLQWLYKCAESFVEMFDGGDTALQRFIQNIGSVSHLMEEKLSFRVFSHRIKTQLEAMEMKSLTGSGGIIFTDLLPGRAIPSKIAAVIGMNFGEFPRSGKLLSFDKMAGDKPELLDPDSKASDQSIFMEALFSAEQSVYISYLGQSERNNKTLHPSTLLETLQSSFSAYTNDSMTGKAVKHPLHLHSHLYNEPKNGVLRNYISLQQSGQPLKKLVAENTEPLDKQEVIALNDVEKFFCHSLKYYCNHQLGIYYSDNQIELTDEEVIEPGYLDKYKVRQQFLVNKTTRDLNATRKEKVMKGQWPLGQPGLEELEKLYTQTNPLINQIAKFKNIEQVQLKVKPKSDLPAISGEVLISGCDTNLFVTASKYSFKVFLKALLPYLMPASFNEFRSFRLFAEYKNKRRPEFNLQSPVEAKGILAALIEKYMTSKDKLFLYISDLHDDIMKETKGKSEDEQQEAIRKLIEKKTKASDYSYDDPYLMHLFNTGIFNEPENLKQILSNTIWLDDLVGKMSNTQ